MNKNSKILFGIISVISLISLVIYKRTANEFDYVTIADQKWMIKNLDICTFSNGDSIPQSITKEEWEAYGKQGKPTWCYYNFDNVNGELFGKLYNGYTANDKRGLAPEGWHLPSYVESIILIEQEGGEKNAGISLMSEDFLNSKEKARNKSGFNAKPGGFLSFDFYLIGFQMACWSSSEYGPSLNPYVFIIDRKGSAYLLLTRRTDGYSVRCIKD